VPSFYMDRFEVTVAAFRRYVEDDPKNKPPHADSWKHCNYIREGGNFENHPVNCVDWHQANAYCEWAGGGRRLCSESEWEKAARGWDGRMYPWGNEQPSCEYAVLMEGEWGAGCKTGFTWPVGSKPAGASPYGVEDMEGNVNEMVADCYQDEYHGAPPDGSADLDCPDKDFTERVRRGLGDFNTDPGELGGKLLSRVYSRQGFREDSFNIESGFRCCRSR
ncbi:MAG: formylglycine-generating enzyme family protein, partial [Deltaproteobacteria bacterium]|nr:formylglycine-generating enzyme family protein [Deltaproteobacteria bacterium]